jgi:hypothetical protein
MTLIDTLHRLTTVACAECGVQIDRSQAFRLDGRFYCSVLHEVEAASLLETATR